MMHFLLFSLVAASQVQVTPVQKVIQLLEGMADKGKKEKNEEQVQFATYKQFCDNTATNKQRAIEDATNEMAQLTASINKAEADAATLTKEIAALDETIASTSTDKKSAIEVRAQAAADYAETHKEYSESIDQLERAVATLKKQDFDREQLLQISSNVMTPDHARSAIAAFLASGDEESLNAPQASAYEFQSGGIVEMLGSLQDKFEDERTELEKAESEAKHQFALLTQDMTNNIDQATSDREAKAQDKASKLTHAAQAKGDLADTTATRDSDQTYLDDLIATCQKKSDEFVNRQQLRDDELAAIAKAVEIMSSGAASGAADKHLPALVQKSKSAFVQISTDTRSPSQVRVAAFLHQKSEELHSRVLSALALRASNDPFLKVRKMIKDLIVRLMEEAGEEAEHKGWCDTEMSTNAQTRKEKSSSVDTLKAEIDELQASIAKGSQELTDLTAQIAEIDSAVATATEVREKESAENKQTIKDAQDASTATQQAVNVLKEFYEKAGEATSFLEKSSEPADAPEIFDTPYQGNQSGNGGVLGMLEVIASDFARLETDTKSAEAQGQKEFEDFSNESTMNKSQNKKDVEHKTAKKSQEETALQMKTEDLEGTQNELDKANKYFEELKPSCVKQGVSYEDRVARRKEEIESLQEALKILNGDDIAFLQK